MFGSGVRTTGDGRILMTRAKTYDIPKRDSRTYSMRQCRQALGQPDRCLRDIVNLVVPTAKKGLAFGSKRSVCMDITAARIRCSVDP